MKKLGRPVLENAKRERLEFRVTIEQKALIQQAADNAGMTLSAWLLDVALRNATARPGRTTR